MRTDACMVLAVASGGMFTLFVATWIGNRYGAATYVGHQSGHENERITLSTISEQ